MTATAADLLNGAHASFLRRFAPFSTLEAEAFDFLVDRLSLSFHPRGSALLTPAMGAPRQLHILQRGKVQVRDTNGAVDSASAPLAAGDCFPIGALSAQRPSTHSYIALEDCYTLQLEADDFTWLMQHSPVFHAFCTHYVASLLNQSRQQLQALFAQRAAEQQSMATVLGRLVKPCPQRVSPDTATRSALELMHEHQLRYMVVVDEASRPLGILTQSDLLPRVILNGADLSRPVSEVMTANPYLLSDAATAYDAALQMATHAIHHLLVVDGEGAFIGVVSERDLFAVQRIGLHQLRAGIESAGDLVSLQRASADIRQLALNLIAQGIGAEQLTQFISTLNDALTRRIIELALPKYELTGVDFGWIAFGSEGRHEQTLSTDQDNGIVWQCPEWEKPKAVHKRLLAFAGEVNQNLAACGFPLCDGQIMASNPELCLTLDEWKSRFSDWIRSPSPDALLKASIFFDFRIMYGNAQLGQQLHQWLDRNVRHDAGFLRMMAGNALSVTPPLGRLRDFVLEDNGTLDLKKSGTRLFVDVARIFALRTGVSSSSTVQRLRQSSARLGISSEDVAAIVGSFDFIQLLRLRTQHLDTAPGAEPAHPGNNQINPDQLNELDRRILKEALRQARKLQTRLKLDYQL
ncbi:MAG: DUF294 nucleotidyltransferase-like domain-containing protein [Thauera sp.]|jgi:CBS domain-containing protein|nr:DUF294 nucleotidyltransferase-like domain-containing protein [Thauera sp.]